MANNPESFKCAKENDEPLFARLLNTVPGKKFGYEYITDVVHIKQNEPDEKDNIKYNNQKNKEDLGKILDTKFHIDVCAFGHFIENGIYKKTLIYFDVKSVELKNVCTGNYTIRRPCFEFYNGNQENNVSALNYQPRTHWFAFREAQINNGSPKILDSFIVADTYEIFQKCSCQKVDIIDKSGNPSYFYLVSLQEIKDKCITYQIQSDILE